MGNAGGGGGPVGGGGSASANRSSSYSSGGSPPINRQGSTHSEVHTTTRPTSDPRFPGGTFESRQAVSNSGEFLGKTSVVRDSSGNIAEVKRGKNSKTGPGRRRVGFLSGLFNFLSK